MTAYNVIDPTKLVEGEDEDISVVLQNFNAIATVLNGGLDNANIAADAAIDSSKIAGPAASSPPGVILPYGANVAPSGWLVCDGASYLRGDYAALFAVIGTNFGAADGTHFNVPDLRGRMPVGMGGASTLASNEGQSNASLRRPQHRHNVQDPGHGHGVTDPTHSHLERGTSGGSGGITVSISGNTTGDQQTSTYTSAASTGISIQGNGTGIAVGTGNGNDSVDTPAFLVVNFIIKI